METTHSCANFNNSDNSNVVLPSSDPEPVGKETNKSEKLDFEESPAVAPKCSVTPPSNNDDLVTGQLSTNTDADTDKKKAAPRRAMILTGQPMPALPPRPVFPPELEHYQVYGHGYSGTSEYSVHMQAYFSSLRHDYEKQLKDYDTLKTLVQEDTYYTTVEIDQLDALDEDPFTLDSFENLMRLHANKGKDFILARVTTQDPNDSTKHYHSYYGAHQINKVLFRTQPEEGLLHRMKARNPLNNMLVVGDVHYYIVSADDVNAMSR
ncbi:hypothetical protein BGX28_001774 [Mortierella sp. GBA30]|nr:hypothetical protein BGX28_001774 [Mortierella sp. GBA30]